MAWRDWARLLRLPLVLTAPGDPVAGYLLGGGRALAPALAAAGAAAALYLAGLVWNDLFDLRRDRRLHPDRPLPRGALRPRAAFRAGLGLLAAGLLLAFLTRPAAGRVGLLLALALLLYDGGLKDVPLLGCLLMGSCRGLSLLMGGAAASPPLPWGPALAVTGYIAAVTALSRREEGPPPGVRTRYLFLAAALAAAAAVPVLVPRRPGAAALLSLALGAYLLGGARRRPVSALVARGVRGVVLLQTAWVLGAL